MLGICSLVCCCLHYIVMLIVAVLGLVFGIIHLKMYGKNGMATAGIVCSAVALALAVFTLIFGAAILAWLAENYPEYVESYMSIFLR